jgi:hypothetical protein
VFFVLSLLFFFHFFFGNGWFLGVLGRYNSWWTIEWLMLVIFDRQQWVGYANSYSLDLSRVYDFKLLF